MDIYKRIIIFFCIQFEKENKKQFIRNVFFMQTMQEDVRRSSFLYFCGSSKDFIDRIGPFFNLLDECDSEDEIFHKGKYVKNFTKDDSHIANHNLEENEEMHRSVSSPDLSPMLFNQKSRNSKHKRRESFSSKIMLDFDAFLSDNAIQTFPVLHTVIDAHSQFKLQMLSWLCNSYISIDTEFEEEIIDSISQHALQSQLRSFKLKYFSNISFLFHLRF